MDFDGGFLSHKSHNDQVLFVNKMNLEIIIFIKQAKLDSPHSGWPHK